MSRQQEHSPGSQKDQKSSFTNKHEPDNEQPDGRFKFGAEYIQIMQKTVGNRVVNHFIQKVGAAPDDFSAVLWKNFPSNNRKEAGPSIQRVDDLRDTARKIFEQGVQLYNDRDYRAAIIRFERARQMPGMGPDGRASIHFNIGLCNFKLNRFATAAYNFELYINADVGTTTEQDQARQMLQRAREGAGVPSSMNEEEQRQIFQEAQHYYLNGQFRKAIIRFERIRQAAAMSAVSKALLSFNIGRCNIRLRRFATAIPYFDEYIRSLGHDPDSAQTQEAAAGNVDLREALDLLRQARQGAGMPWGRLLFYQAADKYQAGNYTEALALFQQLMGMADLDSSQRSMIIYNTAMSLHRLSRFSEAVTYYERYLATDPAEQDRVKTETQLDRARNNAPPAAD